MKLKPLADRVVVKQIKDLSEADLPQSEALIDATGRITLKKQ